MSSRRVRWLSLAVGVTAVALAVVMSGLVSAGRVRRVAPVVAGHAQAGRVRVPPRAAAAVDAPPPAVDEPVGAPVVLDHEPLPVGDPNVHPGDLVASPEPVVEVRESPLMARLGPGEADELIRQRELYGDDVLPAALIEEPSPARVVPVRSDESYPHAGDALVLLPDEAVHLAGRPLSFTVQLLAGGTPASLAKGTATLGGGEAAQRTECVAIAGGLVRCVFDTPPAGMLTVGATVVRPDGEMHFGLMPVRVVPGVVSLTGRFEGERDAGDLVIRVGLTASSAGMVRIEGRLYDAQDRLVGWTRAQAPLEAGAGSMELRFAARLFGEAAFAAPFHLGDVAVFLESGDAAPQLQAAMVAADVTISFE